MKKLQFDKEVFQIEDDIINHIVNFPLFASRDSFFIRVMALFMTRKKLTQKQIQNSTHFSAGKISEEVNHLLEMGLIEVIEESKYGKKTYCAKSAGLILLKFTKDLLRRTASWEGKLKKMKEELKENHDKLAKLNGYDTIYERINFYLNLISDYQDLLDSVDKQIKNIK